MLGSSAAVTAVAMLGGIGVLPSVASGGADPGVARDGTVAAPAGSETMMGAVGDAATGAEGPGDEAAVPDAASSSAPAEPPTDEQPADQADGPGDEQAAGQPDPAANEALPADSGAGRRIVFSQGLQRVWLVEEDGSVARTYLVSGSAYDNLDPGTYAVFSRSEQAWGIDDSGSMRYFVRFTQGDNGGAIGFHDIPVDDGVPVQAEDQLGTPLSHGCIRQTTEDAIALWDFAPVGTEVVVV